MHPTSARLTHGLLVSTELVAAVLLSVALASPRWIEVQEAVSDGSGIRLIAYAGLWSVCSRFELQLPAAGSSLAVEEAGDEACETDSISYRDLRVQLHYEKFTQPFTTFSLIENYKNGMPFYASSAAFHAAAVCLSPLLSVKRQSAPFVSVCLLTLASLSLATGCLHFICAVDFEGLNDPPERPERPGHRLVTYRFGFSFQLACAAFLTQLIAMAINARLCVLRASLHRQKDEADGRADEAEMLGEMTELKRLDHGEGVDGATAALSQ